MTILGGTEPGSVAVYRCSPGFELVGDRRRVCGQDGRFSSSAPICQRKFKRSFFTIVS